MPSTHGHGSKRANDLLAKVAGSSVHLMWSIVVILSHISQLRSLAREYSLFGSSSVHTFDKYIKREPELSSKVCQCWKLRPFISGNARGPLSRQGEKAGERGILSA